MNYLLKKAKETDYKYLVKCKKYNILKYALDLSKDELKEINEYVSNEVLKYINDYQVIVVNNQVIGCLLYYDYEDGIIIDEIFIEKEYRKNKIGSKIIKKLLKQNSYLWVYKNNKKAIKLYKKLHFEIIDETEVRYFMKYTNR